ncbi:PTS system lactose-specific EIIA component [Klebsiella pasteurii]|uniref:PTS lactose/cellobiose transporter subunit IIA n=1 Tax=Klebsiella pasteurii TaxID=2587529 RepID=UPI00117527F1|nr:PTS lactose/cellobiose transporter subunit IIA [Klebsiella pasteurii]VUS29071.1 PTS system lactose-specific EIIA component [Klebsiella pasteurii]
MNTSTIDTEEISFQIIACAGDALSKMHLALVYSKAQQFSEATRLMQEANASLNEGHNSHTRLLVAESEGPCASYSPLLAHAQDSLMNALLAHTLFQEFIEIYQHLNGARDESFNVNAS